MNVNVKLNKKKETKNRIVLLCLNRDINNIILCYYLYTVFMSLV